MWLLRRLKLVKLDTEVILDYYLKEIRPLAEHGVAIWNSGLTKSQVNDLEKIQKVALKIILQSEYESYESALEITGLDTLHQRRNTLCKKFAKSCLKNEKTRSMFPLNSSSLNSRNYEKFYVQPATTSRLKDSAIPFMQRLLNQ